MRKRLLAAVIAGAAAVLTVSTGITLVAAAPSTWTVTPGGGFQTYQAGYNSSLTDTTTGVEFKCDGAGASGTFKSGSGLANPIGTITVGAGEGPFLLCGADGLTFTIMFNNLPMSIRAVSYDPATDRIHGAIVHIDATLGAPTGDPACTATMDGTGAGARDGMVRFQYLNNYGELVTYKNQSNLHAYNVSGCNGLVNSGDDLAWRVWFWIHSTNGSVVNTITSP